MFDVGWSELLIVGVVALLVVGPKDLPVMLRTIGKYIGLIKRQANEFRAQFDEAIRDAELQELRKEVENIKTDTERTMRDAEESFEKQMSETNQGMGNHYEPVPETASVQREIAAFETETSGHPDGEPAGPAIGSAAVAAAAAAAQPGAGKPASSDQAGKDLASGKENA